MDGTGYRGGTRLRQPAGFAWVRARCCAFSCALLGALAVSVLPPPLPVARYDLLPAYGVLLSGVGLALGWETSREVAAVAVCHVRGLAFELVKVRAGSWSYPEPALTKVAGVPLYGGGHVHRGGQLRLPVLAAAGPDPRTRLRGPGLRAGQARGRAAGGRRPHSKA
ncbi:DUF817 family protein [Streptomyces sp. NPDC057950]|uniref:DUF817 family protein n=1 Tax=Streptomyces sp. NPDC057950 TaxID=3346288 RepID=UPI0036E022F8